MAEEEVDESLEDGGFDEPRARAAIEKRNKENQSLRARLKELEPLAAKAREADEANKTEVQKATDARAAAERERDDARLELLRRDVAAKAGLPAELAARLRGSTEAELTADAKELLKLLPARTTSPRAVPELRSGALPPPPAGAGGGSSGEIDSWIRDRMQRR